MTTILPPERTPLQAIAKQVSEGLTRALPSLERSYERQRGLSAIDQLQNDLASAGGDMSKILPALMRAYTLNPNLQRSGLGEKLMQLSGQGQVGGALGKAAGGVQNLDLTQPQTNQNITQPNQELTQPISQETQYPQPATVTVPEGKKTARSIDSIANQYIGEVRPDLVNPATEYGAISTFDSEVKQDISPQEESRLRQQLFDEYKDPAVVNQVVDRIREGVKNRYNEALSKYGFDKERRAQIQDKWNTFTQGTNDRLAPHLQKYDTQFPRTKEILSNKYNQYAGAFPVNMTPEQMHTNAMALLQNDINKLDALQATPSMPPIRTESGVKNYFDINKKSYKDLADMGFTEALREDAIINKDMGNEEFHSILWGDQTSKQLLNEIHSLKAPQEYIQRSIPQGTPQGGMIPTKYNPAYPQQREKYLSELSGKLRRLKPQDDLILSRAMVLDSGGDIRDFVQALDMAQQKGLKLSEFQRSQLQEINIPRVPPLWDLFSEGGQGGIPTPFGTARFMNWAPFMNYLRGKK